MAKSIVSSIAVLVVISCLCQSLPVERMRRQTCTTCSSSPVESDVKNALIVTTKTSVGVDFYPQSSLTYIYLFTGHRILKQCVPYNQGEGVESGIEAGQVF